MGNNSIVSFILIRIFYSFQAELIRVYDTTKSKPEGLWASLLLGAGPALLSWSASVTIKWWWCRSDWDSDCLLTNLYWLSLLKSLFLQVEPHYCSLQTGKKCCVRIHTIMKKIIKMSKRKEKNKAGIIRQSSKQLFCFKMFWFQMFNLPVSPMINLY